MIVISCLTAFDKACAGKADHLISAFYWASSPEGDAYWRRIASLRQIPDDALAKLRARRALIDEYPHQIVIGRRAPDNDDDISRIECCIVYNAQTRDYTAYFADLNDAIAYKLKYG